MEVVDRKVRDHIPPAMGGGESEQCAPITSSGKKIISQVKCDLWMIRLSVQSSAQYELL